jgi:hypothetical protein
MLVTLILGLPALAPHPAVAANTADLAISMVGDQKHLKFGETMTFTVTVQNLGPEAATGVTVGVGVSDSFANFGGHCPDGTVSTFCDLGTLAPGTEITYLYFVMACCTCCTDRVGVAVANGNHGADTVDPVDTNNSVRVETKLVGRAPF